MYLSSPVADGTFLYGFSNKRKGQLFCLDAATGAVKWTTEGRGGDNAAIQLAGDHLMVLTTGGDLLILDAIPPDTMKCAATGSPTAQPGGIPR